MADKNTKLSIIIATVDQATAKINAINERLDHLTKPTREFKKALGELAEKSGLNSVAERFKGVGEAVKESLFKVLEIGAVLGEVAHLVFELAEHFEDLGKKAERMGVGVDFLAQLRDGATRTGASVEGLDDGLQGFSQSLGQARAGTGRMAAFLEKVSPALLKQLKAAKSNEQAFYLLADAMAKIEDPAKRAALAQKTVGDAALAPLLARGAKGIKEMGAHYADLAGSQERAVAESTELGESMKDFHAVTDGVKAALVEGLAPALKVIVDRLSEWFKGHREDIAHWAEDIGQKLPGAVREVVAWIEKAFDTVSSFVDAVGGLKNVAIGLGLVLAGPLIASLGALGIALLTTPVGWFVLGMAAVVAGARAAEAAIHKLGDAGRWLGDKAAFVKLRNQHYDEIKELNEGSGMTPDDIQAQAEKLAAADIATSHAKEDADDRRNQALIDAARGPDISGQAAAIAGGPDVSAQARRAIDGLNAASARNPGGAAMASTAKVTVDFANAPRGTRVSTDPQSTADIDLSVGYQMSFAP